MYDRPGGHLQEESDLLSPFAQFTSERLTLDDAGDGGVGPYGLALPVPFGGKRCEQSSVDSAPERDRVVGHREDVLPERVAGPEGPHGGEIGAPACVDGVVRRGRRLRHRRLRIRSARDDIPGAHGNPGSHRDEHECQADASPMTRHPAQICNR